MAKNKVEIDVKVDDKGTTRKVGLGAKNAAKNLDETAKNAKTADRNIKGTANASSNATKNFSKMSQGMGGLVGAYATLAAQLFAVSAAFNFLKQAGDLKILKQGQLAYSSATGIAMRTLTRDIIAATDAQITFKDASQAAAIGVASGLNPDQLTRLGKAAKDVSAILGRDVTDSFNRLVRGVTKAEPELLDELGIILRLRKATTEYANAIDKDVESLTAFERSQAVANEVLSQAEDKYGRIMAITDVGTNRFAKLGKAFDDMVNKFKIGAEKAAGPLADLIVNTPAIALASIGLFLKPVLTAILPGLTNIATATAAVAAQAQTSFDAATASAKRYEAALKVKAPKIDPKLAQAGLAGSLKGVAPGANKSILAQAQAGKQLNNRQIKALRETIQKKKLLRGKELSDFNRHLRQMEAANTASNRRMVAEFNLAQQQKAAGLNRFKLKALGVFSTIANAAAAAARFIGMAFSFLGYAALAVTLFTVVKGFFSQKEVTKEVAEETDYLYDKLVSVNTEMENFVRIQEVLNDTGNNTEGTISAIGKQLGNLSMGQWEDVTRDFKAELFQYSIYLEQLEDEKMLRARIAEAEKKRKAPSNSVLAGVPLLGPSVSYLGSLLKNRGERRDTSSLNFVEKQNAQMQEEVKLSEAFLERIQQMNDALNLQTDAKIRNSVQGSRLADVTDRILKGEKFTTEELLSAIQAYKGLSAAIDTATKLRIENARTGDDLRDKMFPKSDAEKYLQTLNAQLEAERFIIAANATEAEQQKERIQRLEDEIALFKELNEQKLRHEGERRRLDLVDLKSAPDVEFKALRKERVERHKIAQMELKVEQAKESLATKKKVAFADGKTPTAAQLAEIQKINDEIFKQEELVRRANLALTDGHKISQTLADSFEQGLTSSLQGLIDGTMSVSDAFKNMANVMLNALSKVIAELLAVKMLKMLIGGAVGSIGSGIGGDTVDSGGMGQSSLARLSPDGFRNGGIATAPKGYSAGGIAKGSTSGYPAVLHGTEAVVPLPNGNSIPVEMKGSGATTNNNITVNVSSDGQTSTQGGQGMDMNKMGVAVAAAVQKELQNQKRSDGILNPYGVA